MQPRELRICKRHGEMIHVRENNGQFRCRKCRNMYVVQNRVRQKQKLIEFHGGKCIKCGYNKSIWALEFHHRIPKEKKFSISADGLTMNFNKLLEESKKCDLVCANCHREIESSSLFLSKEKRDITIAGSLCK